MSALTRTLHQSGVQFRLRLFAARRAHIAIANLHSSTTTCACTRLVAVFTDGLALAFEFHQAEQQRGEQSHDARKHGPG